MATTAELQQRLAEAEKAYHELVTGGGIRTLVDQSGERVEFAATNLTKLQGYIMSLKQQLGILPPSSSPLGFWF